MLGGLFGNGPLQSVEKNAIERTLATVISKKTSRLKPRYKTKWKQPKWKPQPWKSNEVQIWIPKGVVQKLRSLEYKISNSVNESHANASKAFYLNEEKFKGPAYRWVPKIKR